MSMSEANRHAQSKDPYHACKVEVVERHSHCTQRQNAPETNMAAR
jgi:hypothetical protein